MGKCLRGYIKLYSHFSARKRKGIEWEWGEKSASKSFLRQPSPNTGKFVYKSPRRAAKLKLMPYRATEAEDLKFIPSWILYRIMRVRYENEFTNYPWKNTRSEGNRRVVDMETVNFWEGKHTDQKTVWSWLDAFSSRVKRLPSSLFRWHGRFGITLKICLHSMLWKQKNSGCYRILSPQKSYSLRVRTTYLTVDSYEEQGRLHLASAYKTRLFWLICLQRFVYTPL